MHDGKAIPLAILMADAFGCPSADGINDVGRTFYGTKMVTQTMPEGVDDATIQHPWLQPFVQRRTGRVRTSACVVVVTGMRRGVLYAAEIRM